MANQDNKQKYIYFLIGLAVLALFFSVYKKKRFEAELSKKLIESAKSKLEAEIPLSSSENAKIKEMPATFKSHKSQIEKLQKKLMTPEPLGPQKIYALKSQLTVNQFKADVHFNFEAPKSFQYIPLSLEGNFAGIYGVDFAQNAQVTALAYKGKATPQDAFNFLTTESDSIPNLARNPIKKFDDLQKLPNLPSDSGIGDSFVWTGKLRNGDSMAAVFMQRSDGEGAYMVVVSGPNDFFKNNDGAFDSVYEKARATRPKLP